MVQTKKGGREGPEQSATKFKVGTKKKGNDGNMWKIIADKNGRHRWQKEKPRKGKTQKIKQKIKLKINGHNTKGKVYFTHDNGGRPFMVVVNGNNVNIYTYPKDIDLNHKLEMRDYTVYVKSYNNVKQIFIGKSIPGDDMHASAFKSFLYPSKAAKAGLGNSILLNLSGNKYVFIGESVYEFDTPDHIKEFYSMIGNNDVPYPVAVGEKNVYFIIEKTYLSRNYFEGFPKKYSWGLDSYARLWGQGPFMPNLSKNASWKQRFDAQQKASLTKFIKKFPKVKIIHKRPGWD